MKSQKNLVNKNIEIRPQNVFTFPFSWERKKLLDILNDNILSESKLKEIVTLIDSDDFIVVKEAIAILEKEKLPNKVSSYFINYVLNIYNSKDEDWKAMILPIVQKLWDEAILIADLLMKEKSYDLQRKWIYCLLNKTEDYINPRIKEMWKNDIDDNCRNDIIDIADRTLNEYNKKMFFDFIENIGINSTRIKIYINTIKVKDELLKMDNPINHIISNIDYIVIDSLSIYRKAIVLLWKKWLKILSDLEKFSSNSNVKKLADFIRIGFLFTWDIVDKSELALTTSPNKDLLYDSTPLFATRYTKEFLEHQKILDDIIQEVQNKYWSRFKAIVVWWSTSGGFWKPGSDLDIMMIAEDWEVYKYFCKTVEERYNDWTKVDIFSTVLLTKGDIPINEKLPLKLFQWTVYWDLNFVKKLQYYYIKNTSPEKWDSFRRKINITLDGNIDKLWDRHALSEHEKTKLHIARPLLQIPPDFERTKALVKNNIRNLI